MPDIQAGEVEITEEEALWKKERKFQPEANNLRVDELGDKHDESAYTHLGRS